MIAQNNTQSNNFLENTFGTPFPPLKDTRVLHFSKPQEKQSNKDKQNQQTTGEVPSIQENDTIHALIAELQRLKNFHSIFNPNHPIFKKALPKNINKFLYRDLTQQVKHEDYYDIFGKRPPIPMVKTYDTETGKQLITFTDDYDLYTNGFPQFKQNIEAEHIKENQQIHSITQIKRLYKPVQRENIQKQEEISPFTFKHSQFAAYTMFDKMNNKYENIDPNGDSEWKEQLEHRRKTIQENKEFKNEQEKELITQIYNERLNPISNEAKQQFKQQVINKHFEDFKDNSDIETTIAEDNTITIKNIKIENLKQQLKEISQSYNKLLETAKKSKHEEVAIQAEEWAGKIKYDIDRIKEEINMEKEEFGFYFEDDIIEKYQVTPNYANNSYSLKIKKNIDAINNLYNENFIDKKEIQRYKAASKPQQQTTSKENLKKTFKRIENQLLRFAKFHQYDKLVTISLKVKEPLNNETIEKIHKKFTKGLFDTEQASVLSIANQNDISKVHFHILTNQDFLQENDIVANVNYLIEPFNAQAFIDFKYKKHSESKTNFATSQAKYFTKNLKEKFDYIQQQQDNQNFNIQKYIKGNQNYIYIGKLDKRCGKKYKDTTALLSSNWRSALLEAIKKTHDTSNLKYSIIDKIAKELKVEPTRILVKPTNEIYIDDIDEDLNQSGYIFTITIKATYNYEILET